MSGPRRLWRCRLLFFPALGGSGREAAGTRSPLTSPVWARPTRLQSDGLAMRGCQEHGVSWRTPQVALAPRTVRSPRWGASQPPVPGQASSGTRVSTRPGHGPSVTRYGLRTAPNSVLMSLIKKQTQNPVTFTGLLTGEGRFWSRTVFSGIRFLSCLGSFAGSLSNLGGGFSLLRRPPSSSVLRGRDEQCSNPPGCNL